jgi:hypothetical protein
MSTKCTIGYGEKHHLYEECGDSGNVYLELNGDYEVELTTFFNAPSTTLMIDVKLWREIVSQWLQSEWGKDANLDYRKFEFDLSGFEALARRREQTAKTETEE